jgi:hypothetical protein
MEENLFLIPNIRNKDVYIPLKKNRKWIRRFGDVAIYLKNEEGEGVFSFAKIVDSIIHKSSQIEAEKSTELIKRNYFQLQILPMMSSRAPIIDITILRHFPSWNKPDFQKPFKPYKLYWASWLSWELDYLEYRFPYDFCPTCGPGFFSNKYWRFYIHILREQSVNYYQNSKLPNEKRRCEHCGYSVHVPYFLEIHDTAVIDFESDYKPVNIKDFIVLCPNCHRKEHLTLRDERVFYRK